MATTAIAAAAAVVLVSSGGSDTPPRRGAPALGVSRSMSMTPPKTHPPAVTVDCARRSEADFPGAFTDPRNLVIGPLVLVGGAYTAPSVVNEFGGNKFPLLVKAGHTVTVRLERAVRPFAGLAYGGLGDGPLPQGQRLRLRDTTHAMTFVACRPGRPSETYRAGGPSGSSVDGQAVTFWSGFVLTRTPRCVPLEVYVDDEPSPRRVVLPLGHRCPKGAPQTTEPAIAVTRAAVDLPRACSPRRVAQVLVDYLGAAGSGDAGAARWFAPELASPSGWYSDSSHQARLSNGVMPATDRTTLAAYLRARLDQHERMSLVEVVINGARGGLADIEFKLARRADDVPPSSGAWNTEGKGAVHCGRRRIAVWSMSTVPPSERTARLCPEPRSRPARGTVLACASRSASN